MKCIICGSKMTEKVASKYHYTMSGLSKVYLDGVILRKCSCGEEEVDIPNIEELHTVLATLIASKEAKLVPEEIRFLRSYMGFSGADFAKKIGTTHNTVSRWENGKRPLPETIEKMLRVMVLAMKEPFTDYKLLDEVAVKESKTPSKFILKAKNSHWLEETPV
jgi:putative zinc finger/helix-turn-helix YgiT family protein